MVTVDRSLPILVVNEQITVRKVLKTCLMQLGFKNIVEAESEGKALEEIGTQQFNLVISEWDLSNKEGVDLLNHMRSDENLKKLPFLMLTSNAERQKIIEAVKAGVSNYLVKPFTPDQLESKLDVIFGPR